MSDAVYEVQTLKDGRWMIEQRYQQEETAIADAKSLFDTRAFKSVKVVRESFDASANLYRETVVYQLPSGNEAANQQQRVGGDFQPRRKAKAAPKKAKRGFFDFLKE